MIKSKLATWDKKRLRFILILFFLALAIPTAILILKAYSQLKWEAFHHYRSQAEELSTRINLRYKELIEIESARAFTDYSFLNVAKNNSKQFLQRSPLSAYPVNSKFPGIIGYFQVDNHGQFTTPLLPPITEIQLDQNKNYGISADEKAERENSQNIIYQILNKNKLINKPTIQVAKQKDAPVIEQEENKAVIAESSSFELDDQVMASPAKPSQPSPTSLTPQSAGRTARSDKMAIGPVITAQTAFDNLQTQKKYSPRDIKSEIYSKGRQRVEDLNLKKQFQEESQKQKRLLTLSKEKKRKRIVSRRIESNVLPSYSALVQEKKSQLGKKDAKLRVNMFESEIDTFEFSLLESGHFVLYRKVWRNGLRYIQGLLINHTVFIDTVIGQSFYKTNVSNASNLTVAYQGEILSTLKSKSSSRFYASNYSSRNFDSTDFNLQGTLLLQNKLSSALDQVELIFSVNNLPAGPGATVVIWLSIILLLILCGGFFILYILGLKQITLARQQQDFVSAISHELKTPLTSIRMYGEMLREGWTTEDKRQQYYDYIFDESERLTRLINNVLQLARMTRNELPVDLKEYTVAELIDTVRSKISSQVERADFKLNIDCDDPINNTKLLADADYFIQVIINLVDNAIKFSSKSEKQKIDISCQHLRNNKIQFTIRDYGPGINKDQMRKIFDLFYRTENELTRETVGTGIGLSLVQQLVKSMHGKIDIINKDPGAEFQITFKSI